MTFDREGWKTALLVVVRNFYYVAKGIKKEINYLLTLVIKIIIITKAKIILLSVIF